MEQTSQTPQGKGMGTAGFVISLIALVLYFVIAIVVAGQALFGGGYGLGIFWLVFSLLGAGLSVMGLLKLSKTGGKKGLAISGMVLGTVAVLLTVSLVLGIGKVQSAGNEFGEQLQSSMTTMADSMADSLSTR